MKNTNQYMRVNDEMCEIYAKDVKSAQPTLIFVSNAHNDRLQEQSGRIGHEHNVLKIVPKDLENNRLHFM